MDDDAQARSGTVVHGGGDDAVGRTLVSSDDLAARVAELGRQITTDYSGRRPLLIGVLKGALVFMADLVRCVDLPLEIDFMTVSSYGSANKSSGVVRIVQDLDGDIAGRDVLVVEDIIDSGLTISYLLKALAARAPASLEVCTLLIKEGRQKVEPDIRYVGFRIPDEYVVGYGLDADQCHRNLPDVRTLGQEGT